MNARVGASRALGQWLFAGNAPQRCLQFALDSGFSGLHLPAAEIRAVIGQSELPGLQSSGGFQANRSFGSTCITGYSNWVERRQREALVGYTQLSALYVPFVLRRDRKLGAGNESGAFRVVMDEPSGSPEAKSPWIITNMRPKMLSGRLLEWQPTCLSNSWRGTMHLYRTRVFDGQEITARGQFSESWTQTRHGGKLRAIAAMMLTMASCMPSGLAAQTPAGMKGPDKAASELPSVPAPVPTEPFSLRSSQRDFSKPYAGFLSNPISKYRPTTIAKASFANSVRLNDMVKDGKIYLSLSDAIALALENNYDIAIARYDLGIADTDILRTKTGQSALGAPSGLIANTLGGSSSILSTGGGPGGTTGGSGGAGSGTAGLTLTTGGAGPVPENLDPTLASTISFDRDRAPSSSFFTGGTSSTNKYNFSVNQGFVTGTNLQVAFNNTYSTSSNSTAQFSPQLSSNYQAQVTQHLLQGAGIWVNKRFMYQALNDRRIIDSAFRQQILYTVNQVETIYWGLVQAYEDVQAKERALDQSTQLLGDNQKQLQIGTMAPLDVVNARIDGGHRQAGAHQLPERTELSAADHQAGHRPQPERSRAFCGAGDSHRPREPRGDSRRDAAG